MQNTKCHVRRRQPQKWKRNEIYRANRANVWKRETEKKTIVLRKLKLCFCTLRTFASVWAFAQNCFVRSRIPLSDHAFLRWTNSKRERDQKKMNDFTQYTRIYPSHWNHKQFYLYAFRLFWLKLRHIARYFFHPRLTVNRNEPSLSCFYFLLYYRYFYFTLFSIVFFFCLLLMEKLKLFFAVFSPVELMEKRGCKQRNRKPTIRLTIVKNKCTRKSTKKRVLFEWCVLCVGFRRVAGEN